MLDGRYAAIAGGSSGVQHRSTWTSAVTSPQASSLGLDLLVSCVAPALCTEPPDVSLYMDGASDFGASIPSVLTDRRSIYSLFCFYFVRCPWVP